MRGSYCPDCDFTYDGAHEVCPTCGAPVEVLDDEAAENAAVDARARGSIGAGIGLLFLLHLLQFVFVFDAPEALFFMGITQFAYALPAAIVLAIQGRTRTMAGVLIGTGITILLNVLAFGVLWISVARA